GTTYNMYAMTAAHRSLPLGTWVQVTNEANGKSVVVEVTDRGPYVANRVMDLSYAAAQKLGYANAGTTHISMRILGTNPNATEVADATSVAAASDNMTETASIIPALFRKVSAESFNITLPASNQSVSNDSSDPVSDLLTAVTDLVSGSPGAAVADVFA
ncbi:MAG TPA: septal ring lytic transglycosylase RlpA family protein, partial [Candidatus Kapabacteria bacterium]|nr:septal ring lytic transglycosylase RlpA family protein [Candidatus Kapabacteria bacterium]